MKRLRECSVLFDIGGITFAERGLVLAYNILTLWPALLLGVPVVKLSQAVGPFSSPINRFFARLFLPKCKKIYPRGEISAEYLASLNLQKEPSPVAADIAFLFDPDYSLSTENAEKVNQLTQKMAKWKEEGSKVIIFSPSTVVMKKMTSPKYENLILDIIRKLDHPEFNFVFLPNSNRAESDKAQNNDILAIKKFREGVEKAFPEDLKARIEWVDWDLNTAGLRQIISGASLIVTSRFHGMIAALSLAVPVYVIGWSHKYREVLRSFQMEDFLRDYKNVDAEGMATEISIELGLEKELRERINKGLPQIILSSSRQFDEMELEFSEAK